MSVFQGSRYANNGVTARLGTLIPVIRQRVSFNVDTSNYYTVVEGDTIDGIAYKEYGNAQLYWAILDANPELQSELDIKPGDSLVIPSASEVIDYVRQ